VLCCVVAMWSVYGECRGEARDLDHDSHESGDEKALERAYAVARVNAPLAVRLSDAEQKDFGLIAVAKRGFEELLGVDAEAEVASRKHEDRSEQGADRSYDAGADESGVNRIVGKRHPVTDRGRSQQCGEGTGAGQHRRSARTEARHDVALLVERSAR
jgi:hypothetical protein